jgi:hypothetical protein
LKINISYLKSCIFLYIKSKLWKTITLKSEYELLLKTETKFSCDIDVKTKRILEGSMNLTLGLSHDENKNIMKRLFKQPLEKLKKKQI